MTADTGKQKEKGECRGIIHEGETECRAETEFFGAVCVYLVILTLENVFGPQDVALGEV